MANIGRFKLERKNGYSNLEEIIKVKNENFAFVKDKSYLLGFEKSCRFCIKATEPEHDEGFLSNTQIPMNYIHNTDSLWILPLSKEVYINISE